MSIPLAFVAAPANASSALWCVGFSDCANKGYSDSSYDKYWGNMYWLMYSGRNCVNYAAFRMVQKGMPNKRPWSGSGNAEAWGRLNPTITNKTPTVGSIAWWAGGAQGAGRLGHVAYVERVISPTEIVISESNWGNDFDWRHLTTAVNWPTGFIHWRDAPLQPTAVPTLPDTPAVGAAATLDPGTWPSGVTQTYQWKAGGVAIAGATGTTFTPTGTQLGHQLGVTITTKKSGFRTSVWNVVTPTYVGPGTLTAVTAPAISGTVQVDQTLTATQPSVSPSPDTKTVQWYADGVAIPGATGTTFVPAQAQIGQKITSTVTVRKAAYRTLTTTSAPTIPVIAPPIAFSKAGGIVGTPRTKTVLTANPGTYNPADSAVSYQWFRDGNAIAGATNSTYTLGLADLTHYVWARVTLTHKYFLDSVKTYQASGPTLSTSTITTAFRPAEGTTYFDARVWAYGTVPTRWVVVTVGTKRVVARLGADGIAHGVVRGLPAGNLPTSVGYAGDGKATAARTTGTALVLPTSSTHTVIDGQGAVTGSLVAGGLLTAPKPAYAPWTSKLTYQWFRDGVAIAGATRSTYRLTHADSGRWVTVWISAVYPGLAKASAGFNPAGRVIAEPVISATSVGGQFAAKATVTVTASGQPASGTVTLSLGSARGTGALVNGVATVTVTGLPKGRQNLTVSYGGSAKATSGTSTVSALVLGAPAAGHTQIAPGALVGTPLVGQTLTATPAAYSPWTGTVTYRWTRAGKPITGATGSSYTLTNADAGHLVAAIISVQKPGLTSATSIFREAGGVQATPTWAVTSSGGVGSAHIRAYVQAAGASASGSVSATLVGGGRTWTLPLSGGAAVFDLAGVGPGRREFVVTFSGNAIAGRLSKTIWVSVR